jgi:hypothetical protein
LSQSSHSVVTQHFPLLVDLQGEQQSLPGVSEGLLHAPKRSLV